MTQKMRNSLELRSRQIRRRRSGKVFFLMIVLLPAIVGLVGIMFDAGLLHQTSRDLQNVADSAALSAALEYNRSKDIDLATLAAKEIVNEFGDTEDIAVTINIPPTGGQFQGNPDFIEAVISRDVDCRVAGIFDQQFTGTVEACAVGSIKDSTAPIALIALHPDPPDIIRPDSLPLTALDLPISLSGTALLGSMEFLGTGEVRVDGAVVSNSTWGGRDENGQTVGDGGPPYALTCTPLLPLNVLRTRDVRVVGGVQNPSRHQNFVPGAPHPLKANRFSVPDPLQGLSTPIVGVHQGTSGVLRGQVTIVSLPLITTTLNPGIYDSILVIAGRVHFNPGIYIIRDRHSLTGAALDLRAGIISADNVMFYIVDDPGFTANSNDSSADDPGFPSLPDLIPSVVINMLPGSSMSPYQNANSEFDGMMIFQARVDQRPIVINSLLGNFAGTIYSKWGHVTMLGSGDHDIAIAAGTIRIISLLGLFSIEPSKPFPAAKDTFLAE